MNYVQLLPILLILLLKHPFKTLKHEYILCLKKIL